jgi:ubiquinone/menaquinone biosynthesis C-methylase UbiE
LSVRAALIALLAISACHAAQQPDTAIPHSAFPDASRPSATIVSPRWSDEASRDKAHEADDVMAAAKVAPAMTVADIGAGEGYYTLHLAQKVGAKGRVLAEDIIPSVHDALALRVSRERLDNVSVKLGTPSDASLPVGSFDRIFMVHMYHEIESPLEFLWRLRPALAPTGQVVVVDADRATSEHGTPPALLICEFGQLGYRLIDMKKMPSAGGYIARFAAVGDRPAPDQIRACALG